jgi:predicted ABC-type sugar transport system permease subunit
MEVANDFLDALAQGVTEQPLPSIRLENTFKPHQFLGTMIGIAVGFIVGVMVSIALYITLRNHYVLFLFPVLVLAGVFLGRFLGNRITRTK